MSKEGKKEENPTLHQARLSDATLEVLVARYPGMRYDEEFVYIDTTYNDGTSVTHAMPRWSEVREKDESGGFRNVPIEEAIRKVLSTYPNQSPPFKVAKKE